MQSDESVRPGRHAPRWPLGVFLSVDAGCGVALDVAGELGVPTAHLHAPRTATRSGSAASQYGDRLKAADIEVTCVFAGFEGESYADPPTVARTVGLAPRETRSARVNELLQIAEFAQALGVSQVGLHLGCIPHERAGHAYSELLAATRAVCDELAAHGQSLHLETGQESADALCGFLDDAGRENLGVNFDPANMILYGSGDPIAALRQLGAWVRSVHCKDATWSPAPGIAWGVETPLGAGDVDFARFLRTLQTVGYDGPLTIEREIPQAPARQKHEIGLAIEMLTKLKQELDWA